MLTEPRITNPTDVSAETIRQILRQGARPTIQFSRSGIAPALLHRVNKLCIEFGDALEVRFYGFYGEGFDASVLAEIPDVQWLSVDCLDAISNENKLCELKKLTKLAFGVFKFDQPNFLDKLPLAGLKALWVNENAKRNFDLSYISRCASLSELSISGHNRNISAISSLRKLRQLTLSSISKKQDLGFVSDVENLRSLTLLLGGRSSIEEIRHDELEELSVIRVQGLQRLGPLKRFPSLLKLQVEDQLQLKEIGLENEKLEELIAVNCRNLGEITGLPQLSGLKCVRIYKTNLNLVELARHEWPPSLDVLALYSGNLKRDAEMRAALDRRGYREFAR